MRVLFLFLLIFYNHILYAQLEQQIEDSKADAILQAGFDGASMAGLAAGYVHGNTIYWAGTFGFSDIEGEEEFLSDTPTRIASITKPMTAIAIMQLHETGKLDINEQVSTYLPEFDDGIKTNITIKDLLQHTSGIAGYKNNKEANNTEQYGSLAEAMEIFADRDLLFDPGQSYSYTTYGYVVLGRIIEVVSDLSYEAYLKKNIWEVAGMENTSVEKTDVPTPGKSKIYHYNGKKLKPEDPTNLSDRIPGGGIQSTILDILKFGDAVLQNKLIKQSTLELMMQDSPVEKDGNGYGLGWELYGENPKHGPVIGHGGNQIGCSALFFLIPQKETAIIVISNTSGVMRSVSNIGVQLIDVAASGE